MKALGCAMAISAYVALTCIVIGGVAQIVDHAVGFGNQPTVLLHHTANVARNRTNNSS